MLLSDVWVSVCLSVAYIWPKSRTKRPRKTKIGTEVAHITHDSDTIFKVKRSKVKITRPLYSARPRWLQRSAWERIRRGKVLLRCVCSAAREALGRPRGEEGRGHIVSPRAQLVRHNYSLQLCSSSCSYFWYFKLMTARIGYCRNNHNGCQYINSFSYKLKLIGSYRNIIILCVLSGCNDIVHGAFGGGRFGVTANWRFGECLELPARYCRDRTWKFDPTFGTSEHYGILAAKE